MGVSDIGGGLLGEVGLTFLEGDLRSCSDR